MTIVLYSRLPYMHKMPCCLWCTRFCTLSQPESIRIYKVYNSILRLSLFS